MPFSSYLFLRTSSDYFRYYDQKFIEKNLSLDDSKVKEYFPVSAVVPVIMSIYQDLLGVRFEKIEGENLWHPGKLNRFIA